MLPYARDVTKQKKLGVTDSKPEVRIPEGPSRFLCLTPTHPEGFLSLIVS